MIGNFRTQAHDAIFLSPLFTMILSLIEFVESLVEAIDFFVPSSRMGTGEFMKFWQILGPLGLVLSVPGCAGAGLAVMGATAGVSMGAGVEHTLNGVAYKTFTAPLDNVRLAALRTLNQMDMPVRTDTKTDGGWEVSATAAGRSIDIDLERLTDRTTRMRVVANKGEIFFKDTSTATEIILQTAQLLQDGQTAAKATREANRKRKSS